MASLPNELVSSVLDFCPRSDVVRAAAISRRWRTVAVDHDDFYFTVRLHAEDPEYSRARAQDRKYRAAPVLVSGLPLDIHLSGSNQWQYLVREEIAWRALLNTVASCMPRVKALSIDAESSSAQVAFERLSAVPAPMLHTLHIHVSTGDPGRVREQPNILDPALFQCSAPRLKTLYLSGLRLFPVAVAAFANVQDLEICAHNSTKSSGLPLATCFPSLRLLLLDGLSKSYATYGATIPSTLKFLYAKNGEFDMSTVTVNQLFRSISRSLPTVQRVIFQTEVSTALDLAPFTAGLTGDLRLSCQVKDIFDETEPSFSFETAVTSLTMGLDRIFDYVFRKRDEIILSLFAPLLNQITVIDVAHISIPWLAEIGPEFPAVTNLCIDVTKLLSPELWPNIEWRRNRKVFGHRAHAFPKLKELAIRKKVYLDESILPAISIKTVELEQFLDDLGLQLAQIRLLLSNVTLETDDQLHAEAVMSKFRDVVYT
ncbi:hypothetical protein BKA62DRAFT_712992 [Auriculariales sp. MPI-PUGE-AT-0066]|nr:hypothetical protein BKA62DRAFT_712992 [Auriculariales sp. MPI-PUGE-AT-0066]